MMVAAVVMWWFVAMKEIAMLVTIVRGNGNSGGNNSESHDHDSSKTDVNGHDDSNSGNGGSGGGVGCDNSCNSVIMANNISLQKKSRSHSLFLISPFPMKMKTHQNFMPIPFPQFSLPNTFRIRMTIYSRHLIPTLQCVRLREESKSRVFKKRNGSKW